MPFWFCSGFEGKLNQFRNFGIWIVIALLLVALFSLFQSQTLRGGTTEVSYSEFLNKVSDGTIKSVSYASSGSIVAVQGDGKSVTTTGPVFGLGDTDLKLMRDKNVDLTFRAPQGDSLLSNVLVWWLPSRR